jgi:hypothetical protein
MKKTVLILFLLFSVLSPGAQDRTSILFTDDFTKLDTSTWIAEIVPLPDSKVYCREGRLFLDTKGGVTVWLNKLLTGNIRIEYTRTVLDEGNANDRLSDLNTFWMASDPRNKNLFTRNGVLESYDSLQLYYVGMGGNTNKTTRFRKYDGKGERTLLKEYTDSAHLLKPNTSYKISIEVIGNTTRYAVNGETWFEYTDPAILKQGYFGFRSTKSRQSIDRITIYKLE